MSKATVDAYGMFFISVSLLPYIRVSGFIAPWRMVIWVWGYYIKTIGVGFALLVQHYRAMRRPLSVERVTGTDSTLFCIATKQPYY